MSVSSLLYRTIFFSLKCGDPPAGRNHPMIIKIVEDSCASDYELLSVGNSVAAVNGVRMTGKTARDVHDAVRGVGYVFPPPLHY